MWSPAHRPAAQKYPRCTLLLEPDELAVGMYRPDVAEPEHSNAFGAQLWELSVLRKHYHPFVTMHALHIAAGAPSTGPGALPVTHARTPPHVLFRVCDYRHGGFSLNPPMKEPPQRRAAPKMAAAAAAAAAIAPPALAAPVRLSPPCTFFRLFCLFCLSFVHICSSAMSF